MGESEDTVSGPGTIYESTFGLMETVVDRLRILGYEKDFVRRQGFKPLSRHYFALSSNAGEQFFHFTSLAIWLLNQTGKRLDMPNEYDDPNATITTILEQLRSSGTPVSFPPAKLKTGSGEQVVYVLDRLTTAAVECNGFRWEEPVYPDVEETEDELVVDDNAELKMDKIEEDFLGFSGDEEEDNFLDLEGLRGLPAAEAASKPEEVLESATDASEWKLEVERVTPSLKVHIRADNKDWRTHVDQMHTHKGAIDTSLIETKGHLDKLHQEITKTLEKIGSREKYLNNQLESLLNEFRGMKDRLAEAKERYRQASGGVSQRSRTLADITEQLDRVKQEMEERGSSMTDGAPLVKIKQSLTRLKHEVVQMNIRIGVLQHILLQAKIKERNIMTRDAHEIVSENEVKYGRKQPTY